MIKFFKIKLITEMKKFNISYGMKLNKKNKLKKGMTYIELIVVLSIFAIMSSVSLFNYRTFQARINIRKLSNDIALFIVQAQKASIGGETEGLTFPSTSKPSYGVYFDKNDSTFTYFADLNNNGAYDKGDNEGDGQVLGNPLFGKIEIRNGNYISDLRIEGGGCNALTSNYLNIVFKRPDSQTFLSTFDGDGEIGGTNCDDFSNAIITISSSEDNGPISKIEVNKSGRIQIK